MMNSSCAGTNPRVQPRFAQNPVNCLLLKAPAESGRNRVPVVRGVARSGARVTVRQAGNLLFETNVAPGAFFIDELKASVCGGNLLVTVHEHDGSKQRLSVPFMPVI
jgi:outer membrane usher protein FimD/PapC